MVCSLISELLAERRPTRLIHHYLRSRLACVGTSFLRSGGEADGGAKKPKRCLRRYSGVEQDRESQDQADHSGACAMGEESLQIGVARKQQVLGDITNRCPKKGFPLVPGKFLIANDTIRKRECTGDGVQDPGSRKRVLGELENISKGKCRIDSVFNVCGTMVDNRKGLPSSQGSDDGSSKHLSSPKARKICEHVILDCNVEPAEANIDLDVSHCANRMENLSVPLDRTHFKASNPCVQGLGEAGLRDNCTGGVILPLWLQRARDSLLAAGNGNQGYSRKSSGEARNIIQTDSVAAQKCGLEFDGNSEQGISGASELLGSKIGNIEELENTQTILKHDTNAEEDMDSVKACSCSFCLKAAYMWTDLLYQDFKGRLSGRSYAHDPITSSSGNPRKMVGLESELMKRWRALFLHTENVLMCESARLQSGLVKLKELRKNCKWDVEMRVPSSKS